MKSILLLAAVYALIINQWHKEKGRTLAPTQSIQLVNHNTATKIAGSQTSAPYVLNTLFKVYK